MNWQPIETAPMDGSLFLAIKAGVPQVGKMGKRTFNKGFPNEHVRDVFLIFPGDLMWNPTHWLPIPPRPEATDGPVQ